MLDNPPLFYFGHHKCATRWLVDIISEVCRLLELRFFEAHNLAMIDSDLPTYMQRHGIQFMAFTNAVSGCLKDLSGFRAFHVIRDPRDLLVSAYFSHLHSHSTEGWSELEQHRCRLADCTETEGLLLDMDFNAHVFRGIGEWDYHHPEILEIKMEDLTRNPYEKLVEVFVHLGLIDAREDNLEQELQRIIDSRADAASDDSSRVPKTRRQIEILELLRIAYQNRFVKKSLGRQSGEEDTHSHYRRGEAGDWKNHFTPALAEKFAERYGSLLISLGYEKDDRWLRDIQQV